MRTHSEEVAQLGFELRSAFAAFDLINKADVELRCVSRTDMGGDLRQK